MNRYLIRTLFAMTACVGTVGLVVADDAVYSCTAADGAVELASAPHGNSCEKLVFASDAAPAADQTAATTPAAPGPSTDTASAATRPTVVAAANSATTAASPRGALILPPAVSQQPRNGVEALLSQHRDAVIEQVSNAYTNVQPSAGANPAVSRRYLMTNRSAYQQSVGVTP